MGTWRFARLGCTVDAIDHAESNFNQLRGTAVLKRELSLDVGASDIDLDRPFDLPKDDYGLALFLGTLYHLKNPFSWRWSAAGRSIRTVTP